MNSLDYPCSGADAFAHLLHEQGVEIVFSVMGNQVNDIAFALNRMGIELITCRHEGNATMMAEAYARASRRIGVVLVIPGPGVSNTASGLLEAQMNCSPVLVVSVRQPARFPNMAADKLFHGLDHCGFTSTITGYRGSISNVSDFEIHSRRALETLLDGRPRPAFLEFTLDFLRQTLAQPLWVALKQTPLLPPAETLQEAAQLITSSRRPLILAGRAVLASDAVRSLHELAVHTQLPVLTTTLGKGAFNERHPLYMGKLYEPACRGLIADADLLIAIGTRFSQVDTEDWRIPLSAPLIHVDPGYEQFNSAYDVEVALGGDLRSTLDEIKRLLPTPRNDWDLPTVRSDIDLQRGAEPLAATLFHELLKPGDMLVVDVHEQGYPLVEHLRLDNQDFLFSGTSLCLGYGVPAAIGARFARKTGRIVAFCGDGGFIMSSAELATAVHYGLDIVFLVANDNAYGTIKNHQITRYGTSLGVELSNPELKAFSHAFGLAYRAADSVEALYPVLRWALEKSGPVVVEVDKSLLV